MSHFFITGYPRSRTAWLANWLTTGPVFCHHDLCGKVDTGQGFLNAMQLGPSDVARGDADSGLFYSVERLLAFYPQARWVMINRPIEEAWPALLKSPWAKRVSLTEAVRETMVEHMTLARERLATRENVLWVRYDELNQMQTLERIWQHCLPRLAMNRPRAALLQTFNVQADVEKTPMNGGFVWR